jgi:hypothetical protein
VRALHVRSFQPRSLLYASKSSPLMAKSSSHESSSVSCVPPWFGRVSCNIEVGDALVADGAEEDLSMEAVEVEDSLTKEFTVEDDESSMEEAEVKLGGGGLSERKKSIA